MSSTEGLTKNHKDEDEFEFCSAVVSARTYDLGTNIYNLCMEDIDMFHSIFQIEESFCLHKWKTSKLTIGK